MFQGESFPLLTTKRVFWRGVLEELLWFLGREKHQIGGQCSVNILVGDFQKKDFFVNKKKHGLAHGCNNSKMMWLSSCFSCCHLTRSLLASGFEFHIPFKIVCCRLRKKKRGFPAKWIR